MFPKVDLFYHFSFGIASMFLRKKKKLLNTFRRTIDKEEKSLTHFSVFLPEAENKFTISRKDVILWKEFRREFVYAGETQTGGGSICGDGGTRCAARFLCGCAGGSQAFAGAEGTGADHHSLSQLLQGGSGVSRASSDAGRPPGAGVSGTLSVGVYSAESTDGVAGTGIEDPAASQGSQR